MNIVCCIHQLFSKASILVFSIILITSSLNALANPSEAPFTNKQALATTTVQSQGYPELSITGSVTLEPVLKAWAKTLLHQHPTLSISIINSGSNSAPIALAEDTANIGSMSRRMTESENNLIHQQQQGIVINEHLIGFDALSIIVHPDNPISHITALQVDQLFSASQRCNPTNSPSPIKTWGQVSIQTTPLSKRKVQTFGRFSSSGTYRWFRENALCGGIFRYDIQVFPSHGAIIQAVQNSPSAIAYIGSAYLTAGVKALFIEPSGQTTSDLNNHVNYSPPLTRPLFLYTTYRNDANNQDSTIKAMNLLLNLIYSPEGQAIANQVGLEPLDDQQLEKYRTLLLTP